MQQPGESRLKKIVSSALGLIAFVVILSVVLLLLRGAVWVSDKALPWLVACSEYTLGICIYILLPLCIFRKQRPLAGTAFRYASLVFGAVLFMSSALLVVKVWGYGGLAIGLILAGVGVIPVALLAALLHAQRAVLVDLLLQTALTVGARLLGVWLLLPRKQTNE